SGASARGRWMSMARERPPKGSRHAWAIPWSVSSILRWPSGRSSWRRVAALAIAAVLFYRAWKADFESLIRPKELGKKGKDILVTLGRVGYASLGVVF